MQQATGFTAIYSFQGGATGGGQPHGSLTPVGAALFGRTFAGGAANCGTVFRINPDGSGMETLHSFAGPPADGANPRHDSMLLIGDMLYGMTVAGGAQNLGVIFQIGVDGAGYRVLHQFGGGPDDGSTPHSVLAFNGSVFYGLTEKGGTHDKGTLFTIAPDGTGFAVCFSFHKDHGEEPHGTPQLIGGTLYGLTRKGGVQGFGVVFAYTPQTSAYQVLHAFQGGATDGATPYHGNLVAVGSRLYGLTYAGGSANAGVIFSLGLDGSGYTVLRAFQGGATDGAHPLGTLIGVPGSRAAPGAGLLYGTTDDGGPGKVGTVFTIAPDGSGYEVLHTFATPDGANPPDNLVWLGDNLYGMTQAGGAQGAGTIFGVSR